MVQSEVQSSVVCVQQCDKLTEALYAALVGCRTKVVLYACRRKGSEAKRLLQHEVEMARVEKERLASTHELEERDHTLIELHREKQRLVERNRRKWLDLLMN